ncbi:MAG: hypothetical protein R3D62_08365 [Xanthobacteraceae bacterium]
MTALDRERSEIAERLGALERAQADEAKQPARAVAAVTMASPTAAKIALFRSLFRGREGCIAAPVGKSKHREGGLRAHVSERMRPRRLQKAAGEVRGVPKPGVHPRW